MKWMTAEEEMNYLRTQRNADLEVIDLLRAENRMLKRRLESLKECFLADDPIACAKFISRRPTESAVDTEPGERARDTVVGLPVSPETANKFMEDVVKPIKPKKEKSEFVIPVVDRGKGEE